MSSSPQGKRHVHRQVCPLCEASCGLLIEVEDKRILSIRGNKADPLSRGHICPKGVSLQDLHEDSDRIREPMMRRGRDWEPISWETALDLTSERLVKIHRQHGADAVAIYGGNPMAHNLGFWSHFGPLLAQIGTRSTYSAASIDILPCLLTCLAMYGHQYLQPVPDVDNTDFLFVLGANPMASNGSLMTVPDFPNRAKALRMRGGKLIVIDPRRTETAKIADEHHFIVPGTDAVLLMSMIHVLFRDSAVNIGHLSDMIDGLDDVQAVVAPFTPEMAAKVTGIAADVITRITFEFARSRTAACYGRIGVSIQKFGSLAQWGIQLLNLLTGNLDRIGGTLPARPAAPQLVRPSAAGAIGRWRTRVKQLPEFGGAFPVAALADEILTPGEGQIRSLICLAGNPASSAPNTAKMNRALGSLEFKVAVDIYLNETSRHAHIFLPATSPLERSHYPVFTSVFGVRDFAKYSPALFAPEDGVRHDWEIMDQLTCRLAQLMGNDPPPKITPEEVLARELRNGFHPEVTLKTLRENPDGIDLGALKPSLRERVQTPNRRIQAAPKVILGDIERLRASLDGSADLLLIGRRNLRSNNSWMHNISRLMARRPDHQLIMNPVDLARRGLVDGNMVRIRSRSGTVDVVVQASEDVMIGVVCLPHGWGHTEEGVQLTVASALPGANFNLLTDDEMIDLPSAGSSVQGVAVTVESIVKPS